MPISIRLERSLERRLNAACRRERKTRSALIRDALAAYLRPNQANLGEALAEALAASPRGFGLKRDQPAAADQRDWTA